MSARELRRSTRRRFWRFWRERCETCGRKRLRHRDEHDWARDRGRYRPRHAARLGPEPTEGLWCDGRGYYLGSRHVEPLVCQLGPDHAAPRCWFPRVIWWSWELWADGTFPLMYARNGVWVDPWSAEGREAGGW